MCCIIHRERNTKEIKQEYLEMIMCINSDGWGCSHIENGNIITKKSMDMNKAIKYIRILESKNIEFIFHARYTTLGKTNLANCHPYNIHNGVMFHNGQIKGNYWSKHFSDSWHFAISITKDLLRKLPLEKILEKHKDDIGPSRFAFFFKNGKIVKHGVWHEVDGVHYSKVNWKWKLNSTSTGNYTSPYCGYSGYESYGWENLYDNEGKTGEVVSDFHYQNAVNSCKNNMIYKGLLRKLTIHEVCKLIKEYPDVFADFFYRRAKGWCS